MDLAPRCWDLTSCEHILPYMGNRSVFGTPLVQTGSYSANVVTKSLLFSAKAPLSTLPAGEVRRGEGAVWEHMQGPGMMNGVTGQPYRFSTTAIKCLSRCS